MLKIGSIWHMNERIIRFTDLRQNLDIEYHFKSDLFYELTYEDENYVFLTNDFMNMRVSKNTLAKHFTKVSE